MQHAVQRAVLNHGNLSGERREAVPGVASPAPSLALAGGNLVTRDRSRRIFPTCTRDTTRIWLNRQCLQGSVLPRQKESQRSTGRRSFVSAQGLLAPLFKTARSQTTWPRKLCTSLHKSGTSTCSPRLHFSFGGCLLAWSRSPWGLAPARLLCSWCHAQDSLSRVVGTKAGTCWVGDVVPAAVTSPRMCHNGSCLQGHHQAAPLQFDLGAR